VNLKFSFIFSCQLGNSFALFCMVYSYTAGSPYTTVRRIPFLWSSNIPIRQHTRFDFQCTIQAEWFWIGLFSLKDARVTLGCIHLNSFSPSSFSSSWNVFEPT